MNAILNSVIPKYLNYAPLSKDLLPIFMLLCCPAFCSRQTSIYTNTHPATSTAKLLFITMRNERALKSVHGKRMDEVFLCITPSHKVHL